MRRRTSQSLVVLRLAVLATLLALAVAGLAQAPSKVNERVSPKVSAELASLTSKESQACIKCHQKGPAPLAVKQWEHSWHATAGVGCYECHKAGKDRPDGFEHFGLRISVLVTPKVCGTCHAKETAEFEASGHARAADVIGSLEGVLGEVVEGPAAVDRGCDQCHGSVIKVLANGKLDPTTWPNEGIGRVNPDGSRGSCSICHSRHTFLLKIARQPESCAYCHLGPDHPQEEIYAESKHGAIYRALIDQEELDSDTWILGKDYDLAPTCDTCHMGANSKLPITHDVGARLSWNVRPEIAVKREDWQAKRATMKTVCLNCHGNAWVDNFYKQYDGVVELGNEKFFVPAKEIMDKLEKAGKLTSTPFDSKIKWTYFELWHHEGRRARMGAAMNGPDYVQWHGFYDVAKIFYSEFIPEAEALMPGVTVDVMKQPANQWIKGLSPETRQQMLDFYQKNKEQSLK